MEDRAKRQTAGGGRASGQPLKGARCTVGVNEIEAGNSGKLLGEGWAAKRSEGAGEAANRGQ